MNIRVETWILWKELFFVRKPHRIQPLPQSYSTSLLLLLFTNILQSHGLVMTQALGLPLSLAVARKQGVSCFDNSMLTQVRTAVFQWKNRPSVVGYFWRTGPKGRNWLLYSFAGVQFRLNGWFVCRSRSIERWCCALKRWRWTLKFGISFLLLLTAAAFSFCQGITQSPSSSKKQFKPIYKDCLEPLLCKGCSSRAVGRLVCPGSGGDHTAVH